MKFLSQVQGNEIFLLLLELLDKILLSFAISAASWNIAAHKMIRLGFLSDADFKHRLKFPF